MGQWRDEPSGGFGDQYQARPEPRSPRAPSAGTSASWPQGRRPFAGPFPGGVSDAPTERVASPYNEAPQRAEPGATSRVRTLGDVPTASLPRAEGPDDSRALVRPTERRALASRQLPPGTALIPAPERRLTTKTKRRVRYRHTLTTMGFMLVALVLALIVTVAQSLQAQQPTATIASNPILGPATPAPSGSGPWTVATGALVYLAPTPKPTPAPTSVTTYAGAASNTTVSTTDVEPCHGGEMFLPSISQWSVPPGCYGNVFVPNPSDYPARAAQGYCNWWVEQNHLNNPNITQGSQVYLGTTPIVGAAIFFQGGVQGASSEGHWAQVVAIAPDGYWMLISEMNFAWRGAGFGRVDYRYVHTGPGLSFYR